MPTLCYKDFNSTEEVIRMNPVCSQAFHFGRKTIYFFRDFKNFLRTEQNCRRNSLYKDLFLSQSSFENLLPTTSSASRYSTTEVLENSKIPFSTFSFLWVKNFEAVEIKPTIGKIIKKEVASSLSDENTNI